MCVNISLLGLEINFYENKTKNMPPNFIINFSIFLVKFNLLYSDINRRRGSWGFSDSQEYFVSHESEVNKHPGVHIH